MIQLEVGKRYVRRDGVVTGVLWKDDHNLFPFYDSITQISYRPNGNRFMGGVDFSDLVAEYEPLQTDYDHLGDLQREHNEMQHKLAATMRCNVRMFGEPECCMDISSAGQKMREEKETACWEALSGMVADNQEMGFYDPPQPDEAQQYDDANPCCWREHFKKVPAIRTFASGATRNLDHNKLDYEGFNCPAAQRAFAEYMHAHRKQADGTMRDGDNWQKSIPVVEYMKSMTRHVQDLRLLHRGWDVKRPEDGIDLLPTTEHKIELLCAIWFNVQGMIHELLKEERNANQGA